MISTILTDIPRLATARPLSEPHFDGRLAWQAERLWLNSYGASLRRRYGGRVQRVSIDAGFTCPNVDGAVAKGGCNFCDNRSFSPSRRVRLKQVAEQLRLGMESIRRRYDRVQKFIAYFQPATNTYAPVDQLRQVFELALSISPDVVGLAIGTRPDCVPDSVLDLLTEIAGDYPVSLEYGMQTIHDKSLHWMNRAHQHHHMVNAIDRSRGRGFETCAHVILGIPGETDAMMMQTAAEIGRLGLDAVKLHNLYAVHGTPLGDQVLSGDVQMMGRDEYLSTVADFLERIPPQVVVERVSGDAPASYLIEPKWCLEKSALRSELESEFARRKTRQGSKFVPPELPPQQRPVPNDETPEPIRRQIETRGRLPVLKIEST